MICSGSFDLYLATPIVAIDVKELCSAFDLLSAEIMMCLN